MARRTYNTSVLSFSVQAVYHVQSWETEVLQSSDASTNQAAMSQMIAEVTQKMKSEFEGLTIDLEPKTRNKRNITAAESDF